MWRRSLLWISSLAVIVAMMALVPASVQAAGNESSAVVVIPARLRIVKLAQDVKRLRPAAIVSYQGAVSDENPVLHEWDGQQWVGSSLKEYEGLVPDKTVLLIGDEQTVPTILTGLSLQAADVRRVKTLDVAAIVTELKLVLKLTPSEVTWLGKRHDLTVVDANADLRKYGRYGKPGTKVSEPPLVTPTMPPAEVEMPERPTPVTGAPKEPVLTPVDDSALKNTLSEEPVAKTPEKAPAPEPKAEPVKPAPAPEAMTPADK